MNSQLIVNLERIGGEAKLLVYHKDGKVLDSYFVSTAPIRAFERMLKGKSPSFAVEAVMRICGICHAAHGINATEAIEDALGIFPPPNGVILREILGIINRIQSHLLHFVLIAPDLYDKNIVDDLVLRGLRLFSKISDALARIGGAPTHPPNIVLGGIASLPKERNLDFVRNALNEVVSEVREYMCLLEEKPSEISEILAQHKFEPRLLASHLYYGDKTNIVLDKIKTLRVEEFRDVPDEAKNTTTLITIYNNEPVEVGPRARLTLFWNFRDETLLGVQKARMQETILNVERALELIDQIDPTEPTRTTAIIYRRGEGVSVFEAPRGILIHKVKLGDEGRILDYKIIVPTMFNIPIMEKACKDLPVDVADVIPRLYDPCIPCTTHFVEVKE